MTATWQRIEHGWFARTPSAQGMARAKRERLDRDDLHENLWDVTTREDYRWVGHLAEAGLYSWFRTMGVPAVRNGGVDNEPDFTVNHCGVGLKNRTVTQRMRPSYVVNVPSSHVERRPFEEMYFFTCYEVAANRLLILGCMSRARFLHSSTLDVTRPHETAPEHWHPAYSVPASLLTPAVAIVGAFEAARLAGGAL